MSQRFSSIVSAKNKISPKVYLVTFDLVDPKEINFVAGQTVMFQVAPGINRSMSIASTPKDKNTILMAHDVSPMGPFSNWTINVRVGDSVNLVGPLGMFVLDKQSQHKKILIATGTGVAPYRSMIYDYLENGGRGEIDLYWGLRYEEDVFWKTEFEALEKLYPNFHFYLILSKPGSNWKGNAGHVGDLIIEKEKNLIGGDYYLCGNKEMVKEVSSMLLEKNVPKQQIKMEPFF